MQQNQQHGTEWQVPLPPPSKEKPIYFAVRFHYLSMLMHSENFKFAFVKIYKYVNFITSAIFQTYQFFIIV